MTTPITDAKETLSSADFGQFLADLKHQINSNTIDTNIFDIEALKKQIEVLEAKLTSAKENAREITKEEFELELAASHAAEIVHVSKDIFGVPPKDENEIEWKMIWKAKTASMINSVDKLENNTAYFGHMVKKNWKDLKASDFFADKDKGRDSASDTENTNWTKYLDHGELVDVAKGKSQVDIYRKELITNLALIENGRALGQLIAKKGIFGEDYVAMAEFAFTAIKSALQIPQLAIAELDKDHAKKSFAALVETEFKTDFAQSEIKELLTNSTLDESVANLKFTGHKGRPGTEDKLVDNFKTKLTEFKAALKSQLEELDKELEGLEEKKIKDQTALNTSKEAAKAAREDFEAAETNLASKTQTFSEVNQEFISASEKVDSSQGKYDTLTLEKQNEQANLDQLKIKSAEENKKLEGLVSSINDNKLKVTALNAEIESAEVKLEQLKDSLQEKKIKLDGTWSNEELQNKPVVIKLKEQFKEAEAEVANAQNKVDLLKSDKGALQSEISKIEAVKLPLVQTVKTLASNIANSEGHLKQLDTQLISSENQLTADKQELELKRTQLDVAESEFDIANNDAESKKSIVNSKQADANNLNDTFEQTVEDLAEKNDQKLSLNTDIETIEKNHLNKFDKLGKFSEVADAGMRVLSVSTNITSLVKWHSKDIDREKNPEGALAQDIGLASTYMGLVQDGMDGFAEMSKFFDATKGMKNIQSGLGAGSAVVGVGPQIASLAMAIKSIENAPDEYKAHYIGEAVTQGANLVMGITVATLTAKAAIAGTTVSSAVPVLGIIASLASAINPVQWAAFEQSKEHINDVDAKTDKSKSAYETSAEYLTELLEDIHDTDVGFYAASTTVGVIGGIGTTAAVASGVGAPVALVIAGITAGLQGMLEGLKQVHLDKVAGDMAEKIRAFNEGVAGFFDQSFEHSTDKVLSDFVDDAKRFIDKGYDSVSGLGSVQMTASDLELAGLSGVGGELKQTQKHFSGYIEKADLATGEWDREEIKIDASQGVIERENVNGAATGKDNMLTFVTPMAAAGNENISTEHVSKNRYETTINISNLKGWTIKDGGDNTTFDLDNIVTKAQSFRSQEELIDIPLSIEANAGDDNFLMSDITGRITETDRTGIFDGGSGKDSATYANLKHLEQGIEVSVNEYGNIQVAKTIDSDARIYLDKIGEYEVSRGKKTELVEYRYIESGKLGESVVLYDEFKDIELLAGSDLDDNFDITNYNGAFLVAGRDGDDSFTLAQEHAALGGKGDDTFTLAGDIELPQNDENTLPKFAEVVGGEGHDKIILSHSWSEQAFKFGALYAVAEEFLVQNDDLRKNLLSSTNGTEKMEDVSVALIANMLGKENDVSSSFLAFSEIEEVQWDTTAIHDVLGTAIGPKVDLADYDLAARAFLNRSIKDDYQGLVTYDFSSQTSEAFEIRGTANNDGIIGSAHSDLIYGGDGNDKLNGKEGINILIGGSGADEFVFDFSGTSEDLVKLIDFDLIGESPDFGTQALNDVFTFNLGSKTLKDIQIFSSDGQQSKDLIFGIGESAVKIENFYTDGYAGNGSVGSANQSFVFTSDVSETKTYGYSELDQLFGDSYTQFLKTEQGSQFDEGTSYYAVA
jgi:Ca2+-binding RTX toxin-like protein